jgi:hypothetical protein
VLCVTYHLHGYFPRKLWKTGTKMFQSRRGSLPVVLTQHGTCVSLIKQLWSSM